MLRTRESPVLCRSLLFVTFLPPEGDGKAPAEAYYPLTSKAVTMLPRSYPTNAAGETDFGASTRHIATPVASDAQLALRFAGACREAMSLMKKPTSTRRTYDHRQRQLFHSPGKAQRSLLRQGRRHP